MAYKIGDQVSVIEDTTEGVIAEILPSGNYMVEIDGFDWKFKESELVLVRKSSDYKVDHSDLKLKVKSENEAQLDHQLKRKFRHIDKYGGQREVVVDLHIQELIDSYKGMNNSQIIQVQLSHFRSKLNECVNKRVKKMIVIHGKGKGVLKAEINRELDEFYSEFKYHDASFQEFGYNGATEIILE